MGLVDEECAKWMNDQNRWTWPLTTVAVRYPMAMRYKCILSYRTSRSKSVSTWHTTAPGIDIAAGLSSDYKATQTASPSTRRDRGIRAAPGVDKCNRTVDEARAGAIFTNPYR
jgi:hypothetical protein